MQLQPNSPSEKLNQISMGLEDFFIICPLGLETVTLCELQSILLQLLPDQTLPKIDRGPGSLALQVPWSIGAQLNLHLKTATRILWRLQVFKVRDFSRLFQKIQKLSWRLWLPGMEVEWKIQAHESRLWHSKRLEETCAEALQSHWHHFPPSNKLQAGPKSTVYLRLVQDQATLSLDLSGERLDRRGLRNYTSGAPLRETLAHGLLLWSQPFLSERTDWNILDPFCGAGTLLWELLLQNQNFGAYRTYNFQFNPRWKKSDLRPINHLLSDLKMMSLIGNDLNQGLIALNQGLIESSFTKNTIPTIFQTANAFARPTTPLGKPLAIISNPPYGERLEMRELHDRDKKGPWVDLLIKAHNPDLLILCLPHQGIKRPKNYLEIGVSEVINNQGLSIRFYCWKKA